MIDYVYGGEYMTVTSNKGAVPYINASHPITGMVAYDSGTQSMKVYDGNSWQTLGGGTANVSLTGNAIAILRWAEMKMQQEAELKALAETSPAIKDLVNAMNASISDYEHKIAMVKALIQKEEKV